MNWSMIRKRPFAQILAIVVLLLAMLLLCLPVRGWVTSAMTKVAMAQCMDPEGIGDDDTLAYALLLIADENGLDEAMEQRLTAIRESASSIGLYYFAYGLTAEECERAATLLQISAERIVLCPVQDTLYEFLYRVHIVHGRLSAYLLTTDELLIPSTYLAQKIGLRAYGLLMEDMVAKSDPALLWDCFREDLLGVSEEWKRGLAANGSTD